MIEVDIKADLGALSLDVQFTAPAGVTALFGASGAGKTSVINAIAGLWRPAQGRIVVAGQVLFDAQRGLHVPPHRRRIGYVFQDARLFPHMSVARNLTYGGTHDQARLIELLGLRPLLDRRPARLSGGERQRVAVGRALMCDPALVLMDEPLAALDAPRKAEIMPYIARLRDETGVPIVYVSHAMAEVTQLATSLVILSAGKVQRAGPIMEVLSDPLVGATLGRRDAGAVLACVVKGYDTKGGVTLLATPAGELVVPGQVGQIGQGLRLRLPAHDIILALQRPQGISALNVIGAEVVAVTAGRAGGVAVGLAAGDAAFWAEVTQRSAAGLGLHVGQNLFAVIKATTMAPDIG